MSDQDREGSTTPKAIQVNSTPQSNPWLNEPDSAPDRHHILPIEQRYFPQWVREWVLDGNGSENMCVPIGLGNSLGIKEHERAWQIEQLFSEGQADLEGLGPIRAHLLNQMLQGSREAPFPPYGYLPYWQKSDEPDYSFTFNVNKAFHKRSRSAATATANPRASSFSSSSSSSSSSTKPATPAKRATRQEPSSAPSRFSSSRSAPAPPAHRSKGKGKGKGKEPADAQTVATRGEAPSAPPRRQLRSAALGSAQGSATPAAGPSTGPREARQASAKRRLQRSRSHSQTTIDARGFAPRADDNNNNNNDDDQERSAPSSRDQTDASTDDWDDDAWWDGIEWQ